jgi:hypothetical protein
VSPRAPCPSPSLSPVIRNRIADAPSNAANQVSTVPIAALSKSIAYPNRSVRRPLWSSENAQTALPSKAWFRAGYGLLILGSAPFNGLKSHAFARFVQK